ncbi:transposase [Paraburkholderia sp. GAS42]|uniref:transposase n=1 Tax=Paraburkholderia sp. GAS42 TaxID=3035135 RepID=UPI003D1EB0A9
MLETGTIDRFASAGNFASYARCVDSQRISNGKKKGEGEIHTCAGRSSRRPTLRCAITTKPSASMSAKRPEQTPWSRARHWHTSWRMRVSIC